MTSSDGHNGSEQSLNLVWGAASIAKFLNLRSRRQAFWLLETGQIPARKVGKQWVASKEDLRAYFAVESAK